MNTEKISWAILVTGWGRNAKDTIEAYKKGLLKKSTIDLIIYEQEPCGAAELAKEYNIEVLQLSKKDFSSSITYQKKLKEEIDKRNIHYIFMLNYKYILKEEILTSYTNRIINIHPSLLPSFAGTKTAIQDALAYGVKITGITTHSIDNKLDEGTILCQSIIAIEEGDTFDTLYPKFAEKGIEIIIQTIEKIEESYFQK